MLVEEVKPDSGISFPFSWRLAAVCTRGKGMGIRTRSGEQPDLSAIAVNASCLALIFIAGPHGQLHRTLAELPFPRM